MVVDDEQVIADTLARILNSSGYEAFPAYGAAMALLLCERENLELVITDVVMPQMNGIELAIEIRKRFPLCKILLFSGQAATSDLLQVARAQGHDLEILSKPVHPKDLLVKLQSMAAT